MTFKHSALLLGLWGVLMAQASQAAAMTPKNHRTLSPQRLQKICRAHKINPRGNLAAIIQGKTDHLQSIHQPLVIAATKPTFEFTRMKLFRYRDRAYKLTLGTRGLEFTTYEDIGGDISSVPLKAVKVTPVTHKNLSKILPKFGTTRASLEHEIQQALTAAE